MIDWDTYQTAYQSADQSIKDILHSSLIPECVAENIKKYELDTSNQKVLVGLFSEKTLGLVDEAQVVEQMRTAGIPSATAVANDITQCLQTKKPTAADTSLTTGELTNNEAEPHPATPTNSLGEAKVLTADAPKAREVNSTLDTDIAETEAALNAIPKIRTMVQDVESTTAHTSSQSELLDKTNRWKPKQ
jgi:hypothetical protein